MTEFTISDTSNNSYQLYLTFKEDNFKFILTDDFFEEEELYLLYSGKENNQQIEGIINFFSEAYKDKSIQLIREMYRDKIEKSVLKEIALLQELNIFTVNKSNNSLLNNILSLNEKELFEIYETLYFESHPRKELIFTQHPLLISLLNSNEAELRDLAIEHEITDTELEFLKLASLIDGFRAKELIDSIILEQLQHQIDIREKGFKEIEEANSYNEVQALVLHISKISEIIYELYYPAIILEHTAKSFVCSVKDIIDSFNKNNISIGYIIEKLKEDDGKVSIETLEEIKFAYPQPINYFKQEHTNNNSIDINDVLDNHRGL